MINFKILRKSAHLWYTPYLSIITYILLSLGHGFFGVFTLALLIPILRILFGDNLAQVDLSEPEFTWSMQYILDRFTYFFNVQIQERGKVGALTVVCGLVIISIFFSNLFGYLAVIVSESIKVSNVAKIKKKVFSKINELHIGYFSQHRRGDLISKITIDISEIENNFLNSIKILIREPIAIFIFSVSLFLLSIQLSLITIILVPLVGFSTAYISKKCKKM